MSSVYIYIGWHCTAYIWSSLSQCHVFHCFYCQFMTQGHCKLSLFFKSILGGKKFSSNINFFSKTFSMATRNIIKDKKVLKSLPLPIYNMHHPTHTECKKIWPSRYISCYALFSIVSLKLLIAIEPLFFFYVFSVFFKGISSRILSKYRQNNKCADTSTHLYMRQKKSTAV